MEPVIKYEYCDDQYERDPIHVDNNAKRTFNEVTEEGLHENQHLYPAQPLHVNLPPPTLAHNIKLLHRTPVLQPNCSTERTPAKKSRKERNILFNPPFYQLLSDINEVGYKGGLSVRCCTCGSVVRGSKNVSSNFIKHLRRSHPAVKKTYDTYKIHRFGGKILKTFIGHEQHKVSTMTSNSVSEDEPSLLQTSETRDEEFNSEFSEVDAETVPNSSENGEINDNFKDTILQNEPQPPSTANEESTVDLSDKTLHLISQMIDEKLNSFVTKAEFKKHVDTLSISAPSAVHIEKNNDSESTKDSSASQAQLTFQELSEKVNKLQRECHDLRLAMRQTEASKWQLQTEISALERNLNQRKLVVKNLTIADPLQPNKSVENLFERKLQLPPIPILSVILLPASKIDSSNTHKGNLLVELKHVQDVKKIFAAAHKLKHTGVFIERESSPLQRRRKEKLLILRKELLRRKSELAVGVRNTVLTVEGAAFYWDDVRGLCQVATNQEHTLNAVEYLKTLTEVDLEEFINVLKNYNVQVR